MIKYVLPSHISGSFKETFVSSEDLLPRLLGYLSGARDLLLVHEATSSDQTKTYFLRSSDALTHLPSGFVLV